MELLIQRVEEITDYIADREARHRRRDAEETWQARALVAESELFARAREVQAARDGERARTRQVAALAEVAVRVAAAQDVAELTDIVITQALAALGAQGGAIAVRAHQHDNRSQAQEPREHGGICRAHGHGLTGGDEDESRVEGQDEGNGESGGESGCEADAKAAAKAAARVGTSST